MAADKWFMKSIEQTLTATGYIIVITTDTPCHLWMRWTTVEPKEHLIQRTKRGLPLMLEKYFCFDVYEDNEQEEVGDTLIHTFIKEPWPICETRYFYFHGEIAGVASKSTTAIFSKHRVAPPPVYEIDRTCGPFVNDCLRILSQDVWARAAGAIWAGAYSASYYQYGSGIRFQDITIPQGSTIITAHVTLVANADDGDTGKTRISAEDVDNAIAIANDKDAFDARWATRTLARVSWDEMLWVYKDPYDSPDIAAVIQEVISRPGWVSGNNILFFWDDFEDRSPHAAMSRYRAATDLTPGLDAPKLHIEYSPP